MASPRPPVPAPLSGEWREGIKERERERENERREKKVERKIVRPS